MKYAFLFFSFFGVMFGGVAQTVPSNDGKDPSKSKPIIASRRTFTPYEIYPWTLRSIPKLLDQYRQDHDARRQNSDNKNVEEYYKSKLRLIVRSLIEDRDVFLAFAKEDSSLSAEQRKIIEEIQKLSFPILEQKDIKELTSEELVKNTNDESSQIGPLVKKFVDIMESRNRSVAPE